MTFGNIWSNFTAYSVAASYHAGIERKTIIFLGTFWGIAEKVLGRRNPWSWHVKRRKLLHFELKMNSHGICRRKVGSLPILIRLYGLSPVRRLIASKLISQHINEFRQSQTRASKKFEPINSHLEWRQGGSFIALSTIALLHHFWTIWTFSIVK